MDKKRIQNIIKYIIALVWIVNGLFCKVLNFVPRHEQIVGVILGAQFAKPLTFMIGISEIAMAIWFLSGVKTRLNTMTQIAVVTTMNILEFILVPDLLLWGKLNSLFALIFILTVLYYQLNLTKENT